MSTEEKKEEKAKPVTIQVIEKKGQSWIVQWVDKTTGIHRAYVDRKEVDKNLQVSSKVLSQAHPYGVPWETIKNDVGIDPEVLARALRKYMVWTEEDLYNRIDAVMRALEQCTGLRTSLESGAAAWRSKRG